MNIYKFVSSRSSDRMKYIHNISNDLAHTIIDKLGSDESLDSDELFYILGITLSNILKTVPNGLEEFTDTFNQITLISDKHKQN